MVHGIALVVALPGRMIVVFAFVIALVALVFAFVLVIRALVVRAVTLVIALARLVVVLVTLVGALVAMVLAIVSRTTLAGAFAFVQLDVTASWPVPSETAAFGVAGRERNTEGIVTPWLTVVGH